MPTKAQTDAADLILSSMFQRSESGLLSRFMIERPGKPRGLGGIGTTIFYQPRELVRAILFVRKHGAPFLRYLSVGDIWSMVTKFVTTSYWVISDETFLAGFEGSYADNLSPAAKSRFAEALGASQLFQPRDRLTLLPLVPMQVVNPFDGGLFFFTRAERTLGADRLPKGVKEEWLPTDQFPPEQGFKGRIHLPSSWLGVHSPEYKAAEKMKAAILGAVALSQQQRVRYRFSGRDNFGGRATIGDGVTYAFGDPHMPALMHNVQLTAGDHPWLRVLDAKLASSASRDRKQIAALEYFYRAWFLNDSARFPVTCMTLDAVFGSVDQATRSVIDGVRSTIGAHVDDARLRLLMELRGSVIHGGAPDVYESSKYARYYDRYETDPLRDLELVVAQCLRHHIFGEAMAEHPHPEAAQIAKLQAEGKLPARFEQPSILEPSPADPSV